MAVKEILDKIASHMVKGMMFHEQMAEYYLFLNLPGYSKCHEYHFMEETCCYRKLCKFYQKNYHRLIKTSITNPDVIPSNWFDHVRSDVASNEIQSGVKTGLESWVAWEKDTKKLYETSYKDLLDEGDILAASYVQKLIKEVSEELSKAESYWLTKRALDYNLSNIISEQKSKHDKYKCKLEKIGESL